MVKSNVISATNANRLFWLGRYEERVHLTLHLLRKCYDAMIDGKPNDYNNFWQKLDICGNYATNEDFTMGMMYDEKNPSSVLSAQICAQDNAMMLRAYIATGTLAYLEMSVALMKRLKERKETNIIALQPVTDWSLAFWGSADERVTHANVMTLMNIGRKIESIDILTRFDYPYERIRHVYDCLRQLLTGIPNSIDPNILTQLDKMLTPEAFNLEDAGYKAKLIKLTNILIRV